MKLTKMLCICPFCHGQWHNHFVWLIINIDEECFSRASLDRMQIEQIGIGQLHWSTANYAPLQELALWDGLVAMYEKVTNFLRGRINKNFILTLYPKVD